MGVTSQVPDARIAQIMMTSPEAKRVVKRKSLDLDSILDSQEKIAAIQNQSNTAAMPFDELELRPPPERTYELLNPFEKTVLKTFSKEERDADPLCYLEQYRITDACTRCANPLCKVAATKDGNAGCGSLCGIGGQVLPSKDGSKRTVGKAEECDGKKKEQYEQASAFDKEKAWSQIFIDEREIKSNDKRLCERVQTRFAQCKMQLDELSSGPNPIIFSLWADQQAQVMGWVKAACVQWGLEGADPNEDKGSSIFWTCVLVRNAVAVRAGGTFGLPTPELAAQATMDSLAERVGDVAGFSVRTEEGSAAVTKGGGKDARAANKHKYRKMCVYSLGNTEGKRTAKTAYLNQLMLRAGVHEGRGFCEAIRQNAAPIVLGTEEQQRDAIGPALVAVKKIRTWGLNKHTRLAPLPSPPPPPPPPLALPPLALPPPTGPPPPSAPPSPAPEDGPSDIWEVSP